MLPDRLSCAQPWAIPKLARGPDWDTDLLRVPHIGLFESFWPHRTLSSAEILMFRDPNLRLVRGLRCDLGSYRYFINLMKITSSIINKELLRYLLGSLVPQQALYEREREQQRSPWALGSD